MRENGNVINNFIHRSFYSVYNTLCLPVELYFRFKIFVFVKGNCAYRAAQLRKFPALIIDFSFESAEKLKLVVVSKQAGLCISFRDAH